MMTIGARLELAVLTEEVARSLLVLPAEAKYEAVEALTSGRRLSAADLEDAVPEFELMVAPTPADQHDTIAYSEAWHSYRLTETSADVRRAYYLTAEVWTSDGELSGLTLEVTVWVDEDGVCDVEVDDLHTL